MGAGIQYTYSQRNFYNSNLYGGSIITFNPIPEIQLSAELEQLRVNVSGTGQNNFSDNFWNTGLFHRRGIPYRKCNIGCTLQCFIQR
jgi:hypothetical protein